MMSNANKENCYSQQAPVIDRPRQPPAYRGTRNNFYSYNQVPKMNKKRVSTIQVSKSLEMKVRKVETEVVQQPKPNEKKGGNKVQCGNTLNNEDTSQERIIPKKKDFKSAPLLPSLVTDKAVTNENVFKTKNQDSIHVLKDEQILKKQRLNLVAEQIKNSCSIHVLKDEQKLRETRLNLAKQIKLNLAKTKKKEVKSITEKPFAVSNKKKFSFKSHTQKIRRVYSASNAVSRKRTFHAQRAGTRELHKNPVNSQPKY